MRIRSAAGFAALLFALSGCAKIPIATQWKLRTFKLETADLRPLRVAVRAPNWIIPTPDSGKILLTYWREGDEGSRRTTTFRLKRANYPGDREALVELAGAEPMAVFEIDRRDLTIAAEAQADAQRRKAESPLQNRAEMTIDRAGCRTSEAPPGPMRFDLYVHTDDATGWLAFLQTYDVRPDAAREKEFLEKLADHVPRCGKLANRLDPPADSK